MDGNEKRVKLKKGSAIVDKNASKELISALNKMVKCAYDQLSDNGALAEKEARP